MTKKQFLDILGSRLRQQFSQDEVMKQIRYYDNYLGERMAQGVTEEEAVAELGDPLLIAKTIMDTSGETGSGTQEHTDPGDSFSGKERAEKKNGGFFDGILRHKNLIIAIVAAVLILMVVFKVSAVVMRILAPVVLPVLLVVVIVRMIKHTKND